MILHLAIPPPLPGVTELNSMASGYSPRLQRTTSKGVVKGEV